MSNPITLCVPIQKRWVRAHFAPKGIGFHALKIEILRKFGPQDIWGDIFVSEKILTKLASGPIFAPTQARQMLKTCTNLVYQVCTSLAEPLFQEMTPSQVSKFELSPFPQLSPAKILRKSQILYVGTSKLLVVVIQATNPLQVGVHSHQVAAPKVELGPRYRVGHFSISPLLISFDQV